MKLRDDFKTEVKDLEKHFRRGGFPVLDWEGFDPRKGARCVDERSVSRSILLSYCQVVPRYYDLSGMDALEIGVEKHRTVCLTLGLKNWKRLDRLNDVGGNKVDYQFDFVENFNASLICAFDVVVCSNALEHTFQIMRGFDHALLMGKHSSFFYFSIPFAMKVHGFQDYWRVTPDCMRKILEERCDDYVVLEQRHGDSPLYGVSAFAVLDRK